jgi:hypothetical protein
MTTQVVKTQQELDAALADEAVTIIHIDSPRGVWLRLTEPGSATVEAYGSATVGAYGTATVRAYGTATVEAYGSATVRAYGTATVRAYDTATVRAYGSATVGAYGTATVRAYDTATVEAYGSATVRAYDTATVRAYGTATVEAYDTATVRAYGTATVGAYGTATVRAYDTATVRAYGSATVRAYGSATVRAYGSATVEAAPHVAVHLHSARATITGGVVIDIANLDLTDPRVWADHHGVQVIDGEAILYKATGHDLIAGADYGKPTSYQVGTTVTAQDWRDNHDCGGGLHISPRPDQARRYRNGEDGTRYLRVAAPLADLRPIEADKAKARSVRVLAEVDIDACDLPAAGGAQ